MPPRKSKITSEVSEIIAAAKPKSKRKNKKEQVMAVNADANAAENENIVVSISGLEEDVITEQENDEYNSTIFNNIKDTSDLVTPDQIQKAHTNKKRGRKPKGGKIISNLSASINDVSEIPNIILHLKCHIKDLKSHETISNYDYSPSVEEVQSYNQSTNTFQCSEIDLTHDDYEDRYDTNDNEPENNDQMSQSDNHKLPLINHNIGCTLPSGPGSGSGLGSVSGPGSGPGSGSGSGTETAQTLRESQHTNNNNNTSSNNVFTVPNSTINTVQHQPIVVNDKQQKEIMKKINKMKLSFHNSEIIQTKGNNRSACFWDTCDFDTQIYYIPTSITNDTFQVYGCFCSPECAMAYLLKERVDTSTKFERLHLIQLLYGGIYQYAKGIKPAPQPYYLLDKYYGILTIKEYRQLFKGSQMIYVVNKPMTHILPELYEDNNDFLVNSKVIPANNMKLKKRYKTMIVQNSE